MCVYIEVHVGMSVANASKYVCVGECVCVCECWTEFNKISRRQRVGVP